MTITCPHCGGEIPWPPAGLRVAFAGGALVVDTGLRMILTRAGEEVHVTPNEYALLEVLAAGVGTVVSHDDIVAAVWHHDEPDPADADRIKEVRVYVSRINRHPVLGMCPGATIRGIRGRGYIMHGELL